MTDKKDNSNTPSASQQAAAQAEVARQAGCQNAAILLAEIAKLELAREKSLKK